MSKLKRNILITIFTIVCILAFGSKSFAMIYLTDLMDMAAGVTQDDYERFMSDEILGYLGQNVRNDGWTAGYSSACIDPADHGGGDKQITNIFDIGRISPGSVETHSGYGVKHSSTSQAAYRMVEIGYYATKNYINREHWGGADNNPYGYMMQIVICDEHSLLERELGLQTWITGHPGMVHSSSVYKRVRSEGINYADSTKNYKFEDRSTKDAQTIEYVNGKTYIGPYKVEFAGTKMKEAKVWTQSEQELTTTTVSYSVGGENVNMADLGSYMDFYLVFDGEIDSAQKVSIYNNTEVCKARIIFLAGDSRGIDARPGGQDIIIHAGEIVTESYELSLPEVPFSYIKIKKRDGNTNNALANVGFIIYNEEENKWVQDGTPVKYVDNKNDATIYRTDNNGEVTIRNLNKKGTYSVYEVMNPNFGYNGGSLENPYFLVEADIKAVGQTVTLDITNQRNYIKLSGYVWEDIISQKQSIRNDLYNQDENDDFDKLLANVRVSLRDKNGNLLKAEDGHEIQPRRTNSQGRYEFGNYLARGYENEKVLVKDIVDGAYIEFEYNGMCFKSIPLNPNADNGSKATDETNRNKSGANNEYFYSTRYATVTSNEATDTQGRVTSLEYDFANNKSTLKYSSNTGNYIYGYNGQAFPIDGIDNKYKIFANTKDANNGIMGKNLTENDIYEKAIDEITNINLGLAQREMPDLAVVQDIQSAKVTLNGYEHTYQYAQRFDNPGSFNGSTGLEGGEDGFNVAVKFGEKYGSQSYTRAIYSSDLVYNGQQDDDEQRLKVYITYRIAVRNEATNIYTKLNELANYYDDDFELVATGEGIDAYGNVTNLIPNQVVEGYNQNGYKKSIIYAGSGKEITPVGLNQNNTIEIYVQYRLNNDALNSVLNGDVTLRSITEVSSYSSFEGGFSTVYSGVDRDSRPDSITPNDRNTYEDDTDSAPTLILQVHDARVTKGTIWEDSAIQELVNGEGFDKRREGDGRYSNSQENVIQNVRVELLSVQTDQNGNVSYPIANLYQTSSLDKPVSAVVEATGTDGKYEFSGIIPGHYMIRYTYGNNSIICDINGNKVEDMQVQKYKSTKYRDGNKTEAEADNDYWYRNETSKDANALRLSDARDIRGLYGDQYIDVVDRRTSVETVDYAYASYENTLSEIQAETREFDIKLDYDVNLDNISAYGADLKFEFDNIDFGIIRKPIQEIKLTKEISYIEIVLANGQSVISGDPREGLIQHLKLLPDGKVYIEIDNEIIQGATLKVEYEVKVDNTACEVDYNSTDYYYYNIIPSNYRDEGVWRMATVTNLYDYLSNDLNYDENAQKVENDDNPYRWNTVTISQEQVQNGELSQDAYNDLKNYMKILETDYFEDMSPELRQKTAKLYLTRLLSNNELDFTFDNDVEVHTGEGRIPDDSIPGNYVPSESPKEPDEAEVEIIITGPTGENQNYTMYFILGISIIVIFTSGIILIKRFLRNK